MSYSVSGARLAKQIALRCALRSRGVYAGVEAPNPSGTGHYPWLWLRDFVMMVRPFPGYWGSARLRAVLDLFASTVGGDPFNTTAPAEHIADNGTAYYRPGHTWGYEPCFDSASYFARLLGMTYRAGDTAAWAAHKTAAIAALDGSPRQNGLLYSDPALVTDGYATIGWGFEDTAKITGRIGMASALHAIAYRELAAVATLAGDTASANACTASADALIAALATLRRGDGFYDAATSDAKPHVILTALIVSEGLCSAPDRTASAGALVTEYLAGTITQRGAVRHLVSPAYFTASPTAQNAYQNGAYWLGEWVTWLADSLAHGGRADLAAEEMQAATDEVLRQHRVDALGPWEWQYGASRGATLSGAAGGFVADLTEALPETLELTISSGAASTDLVHGHAVTGARITAAAPVTATVVIEAAPMTNALGDPIPDPTSFDAYQTVLTLSIDNATTAVQAVGASPLGAFGARVRARVSAGSLPDGAIVTLLMPHALNVGLAGSQPVPPGYVLEWGSITGHATADSYSTSGTVYLRDDTGAAVVTSTGTVGPNYAVAPTIVSFTVTPSPHDRFTVYATIEATDDVGVTAYACTVNTEDAPTTWQGSGSFAFALGAGTHTLRAYARDAALNVSAATVGTITIAPDVPQPSGPTLMRGTTPVTLMRGTVPVALRRGS